MTETELERAVLGFVNERLLRGKLPVNATDRLFEEGHLDSVRVLELIAFVEEQIGRRVPDRQVRLATFRSARAIARAFAGDTPEGDDEQRREYHTDPSRFRSPLEELRRRGELLGDDASASLAGHAARLFRFFDETFARWGRELGGCDHPAQDTISIATLERAGFTEAFPQLLVAAPGASQAYAPAACYHVYAGLAGRVLERGVVHGVECRCRRAESENIPLERPAVFTMREIVTVGRAADVDRVRHRLLRRLDRFVTALALDGVLQPAADPFFVDADRGRVLAQQAGGLKLELQLTLADGRRLAVASLNRHLDHFGRAFGITVEGAPAHSGCVAFGIERWTLAFLTQHGLDPASWPPLTRTWMDRGTRVATS